MSKEKKKRKMNMKKKLDFIKCLTFFLSETGNIYELSYK